MRYFYSIITLVGLLLIALPASAEDREDTFMLWTTTSISKSFGQDKKWSLGLHSEYRHQFHEGVSKTSQYFLRPNVAYKAFPWMSLKYQMDFAFTSSGFRMRFIPELTFTKKTGDFTLSLRQRALITWKIAEDTNSTVLRTRAKAEYSITQTPMSVHFAVEPYWCEFSKDSFAWLQKVRWYAGFNIKLIDGLTLIPQYVCQAYHNHKGIYDRRTYDDHVFYLTFAVKL